MFRRRVTTTHTVRFTTEESHSHDDLPMAATEFVADPEQVPYAQQIFDTKKLYKRWATCCKISLHMASIGLEHANDLETRATIWGTFGILLGSQQMQEEANETNRRAHEARKSTLYFSALFLAGSVFFTGLYWAIEEGLVGTIVKSFAACGKSIAAAVSSACSKVTGMFKRNKTVEQNNITKVSGLEEEGDVLDGVEVIIPQNPEQLSSLKQQLFNHPPAILPSGAHLNLSPPNFRGDAPVSVYPVVPSAPSAHQLMQSEQATLKRKSSLDKLGHN